MLSSHWVFLGKECYVTLGPVSHRLEKSMLRVSERAQLSDESRLNIHSSSNRHFECRLYSSLSPCSLLVSEPSLLQSHFPDSSATRDIRRGYSMQTVRSLIYLFWYKGWLRGKKYIIPTPTYWSVILEETQFRKKKRLVCTK